MQPNYLKLVEGVSLPRVALVRQTFAATEAGDPARAVHEALAASPCPASIRPGMRIALTVGSRGLAGLTQLVSAIVAELKARGAQPFIVPAMGSHGGATAEGQRILLGHLGVTEESAGCPIHSSMETVEVGRLDNGLPVRIDRLANEADGIVLFNRIKPHTGFRAPIESGLAKMLAIGLGKQSGAELCHSRGYSHLGAMIMAMAKVKLAACRVLFGIGTIENAYDRLAKVVVLPAENLMAEEERHLVEAMRNMPRLPLGPPDLPLASGPLDVLVVDEIGKEFSGNGMDPNITGRSSSPALSGGPDVTRIAILRVSAKSGGNATGVARADVITERVFQAFDRESVYANVLTSGLINAAGLPMTMPDDRTALQTAVKTCCPVGEVGLLRVPNTLRLEYLYASEALLPALRRRPGIEVLTEPRPMTFDRSGTLMDPWPTDKTAG